MASILFFRIISMNEHQNLIIHSLLLISLLSHIDFFFCRYKRRFLRLSILLLFSCSFAYYRHNSRCEAYVYSLFALCEYLLVAMNVFFHGTFKYDFAECNVYLFWVISFHVQNILALLIHSYCLLDISFLHSTSEFMNQ